MKIILNIAIIGYNYELSCKALWEIVNNDKSSKPKVKQKNNVIMEDDTKYIAISNIIKTRGNIFDQLIIVDDSRWKIFDKQYEVIDYVKERLFSSYVPEKFQIQQYEYPMIG